MYHFCIQLSVGLQAWWPLKPLRLLTVAILTFETDWQAYSAILSLLSEGCPLYPCFLNISQEIHTNKELAKHFTARVPGMPVIRAGNQQCG